MKGVFQKINQQNNLQRSVLYRMWRFLRWMVYILVGVFVVAIIARVTYLSRKEKTDAQVAKIHATKLTMDDVLGTYLPPDPGDDADKTVQGIDANNNGIRDDVELAIFREYPNSAKTRAPLLQYALALQMEVTQPIVNSKTVTEVITEQGRADTCLADSLVPGKTLASSRSDDEMNKIDIYIDFLESKQRNTHARKKARNDFVEYVRSFGDSTNKACDIDSSTLSK